MADQYTSFTDFSQGIVVVDNTFVEIEHAGSSHAVCSLTDDRSRCRGAADTDLGSHSLRWLRVATGAAGAPCLVAVLVFFFTAPGWLQTKDDAANDGGSSTSKSLLSTAVFSSVKKCVCARWRWLSVGARRKAATLGGLVGLGFGSSPNKPASPLSVADNVQDLLCA